MYQVLKITPDYHYQYLTRSWALNGYETEPVFTADASDKRIRVYQTKDPALKKQAEIITKLKCRAMTICLENQMEIEESIELRCESTLNHREALDHALYGT